MKAFGQALDRRGHPDIPARQIVCEPLGHQVLHRAGARDRHHDVAAPRARVCLAEDGRQQVGALLMDQASREQQSYRACFPSDRRRRRWRHAVIDDVGERSAPARDDRRVGGGGVARHGHRVTLGETLRHPAPDAAPGDPQLAVVDGAQQRRAADAPRDQPRHRQRQFRYLGMDMDQVGPLLGHRACERPCRKDHAARLEPALRAEPERHVPARQSIGHVLPDLAQRRLAQHREQRELDPVAQGIDQPQRDILGTAHVEMGNDVHHADPRRRGGRSRRLVVRTRHQMIRPPHHRVA